MFFNRQPAPKAERAVIVNTNSGSLANADGQHDCAGTWTLVTGRAGKNMDQQLKAAEGIDYLVHRKDKILTQVYKVVGFHTERRDQVLRSLSDRSNVDGWQNGNPGISVGIRFHLRLVSDDKAREVLGNVAAQLGPKPKFQGCTILDL